MPPPLYLLVDKNQPQAGTVVHVAGEVDLATAGRLRRRLRQLLAFGTRRLVLDLTRVTFIDSAGLGVLVGAYRDLGARPGCLRLVATYQAVVAPLRLSGLTELLPVHATVAEAVQAARAATAAGPAPHGEQPRRTRRARRPPR
jgi:anti-sigma B factor antagonist